MAKTKRFDPFGRGYDTKGAKKAGITRVKGKMGSRDPKTGTILKGRGHKTFGLTQAADELRGYAINYDPKKGRYVSRKKR